MHQVAINPQLCPDTLGGHCALCLEACPSNALLLKSGPAIQAEKCLDCGICAAVCPTGALSFPAANDVVESARRSGGGPLLLRCPKARRKGTGELPLRTCLSSLSLEILLELSLIRRDTVTLACGDCEDCRMGDHGRTLRRTVKLAEAVLAASPGTQAARPFAIVRRQSAAPDGTGPASGQTVSRRGFLNLFRSKTAAAATVPGEPPVGQAPSGNTGGPAKRRHLASLLATLMAQGPVPEGLASGRVRGRKNGACTACGACARVCPTNALTLEKTGGTCTLSFTEALCVGCGSCANVCLPGFLEPVTSSLEAMAFQTTAILQQSTVGLCRRCHAESSVLSPSGLCPICSRKLTWT